MNPIHQPTDGLELAQVLTVLSVVAVAVFRHSVLKIMFTAGIAFIIAVLVSGIMVMMQEFR